MSHSRLPRTVRLASGLHEKSKFLAKTLKLDDSIRANPDLDFLRDKFPQRWSASAIAAALAVAPEARSGVDGWAVMLDELDEAIRAIVWKFRK